MRIYTLLAFLIFVGINSAFPQKGKQQTNYYHQELKQSEGKLDDKGYKTGLWKFWSAKGDLVMTTEYKNDTLNGIRLVEETNWNVGLTVMYTEKTYAKALERQKNSKLDTIIDRIPFRMGKMHGTRKLFLENGNPLSEIDYLNDKKHGEERMYHEETGKIVERVFYFEGKSDSAYSYESNGNLLSKSYKLENGYIQKLYLNGKLASVTTEKIISDKEKQTITCAWANGKEVLCDTVKEFTYDIKRNTENYQDDELTEEIIVSKVQNEDLIFDLVEQEPKFPGGEKELFQYIQTHLFIDTTKVSLPLKGKVFFQIVIRADGKVTDGKILRGLHPEIDRAVLDMISKMPNWIPGEQAGKKVNVRYNLPVPINME